MTRTDHTAHDHPATPQARAACRKASADRNATVSKRATDLLAACDRNGVITRRYLPGAVIRLGLTWEGELDEVSAAYLLASARIDMGGGRYTDGITFRDVCDMYS